MRPVSHTPTAHQEHSPACPCQDVAKVEGNCSSDCVAALLWKDSNFYCLLEGCHESSVRGSLFVGLRTLAED